MIRPYRRLIIERLAARTHRNAPPRLVFTTDSYSSSVIRISNWSRVIPAFATSTSTGPWSFSTCAKAAFTDSVSVTSQVTPANPAGGSPVRYVTVTTSPSAAIAWAIARPIPRFPPVTSTLRAAISSPLSPSDACSNAVTLADPHSAMQQWDGT
jgi:hypothetical protein